MSRKRRSPRYFLAASRAVLLSAALSSLLGACGRRDNIPMPPSSPPRPMTSVRAHIDSAILTLHALPSLPHRGFM